ncbi:hypothetical protein ACFS27_04995 [Promicromonospora vindobonensis]|uniref:Uncharacterized protein n=1 Tax=Promicromonospora vindobonensis TaxID=195748 RepID=A0ABW5VMR4_9MICO
MRNTPATGAVGAGRFAAAGFAGLSTAHPGIVRVAHGCTVVGASRIGRRAAAAGER